MGYSHAKKWLFIYLFLNSFEFEWMWYKNYKKRLRMKRFNVLKNIWLVLLKIFPVYWMIHCIYKVVFIVLYSIQIFFKGVSHSSQ